MCAPTTLRFDNSGSYSLKRDDILFGMPRAVASDDGAADALAEPDVALLPMYDRKVLFDWEFEPSEGATRQFG